MARRRTEQRASGTQSLNVALQTVTIFHGYVQQADAKLATTATLHLGFTAVAATRIGTLTKAWSAGPFLATTAVATAILFSGGFLIAGYHLITALRPRLHGPSGPNRFGLVRTGEPSTPSGDLGAQEREAWSLISTLADIAQHKHERMKQSLPWMALMPIATIAWLALAAYIG